MNLKELEEAVMRGVRRGFAEDGKIGNSSSETVTSTRTNTTANSNNTRTVSNSSPASALASVLGRAKDILRANATNIASSVEKSTAASAIPKRKRFNHQYSKAVPKKAKIEEKVMELICLDYVDEYSYVNNGNGYAKSYVEDYPLLQNHILLNGTVSLMTDDTDKLIREKIVDVLKSRLPNIGPDDIDFVKVSRRVVSTPVIKDGHQWDFKSVKALVGQARLYMRLTKAKHILDDTLFFDEIPEIPQKVDGQKETPGTNVQSLSSCCSPESGTTSSSPIIIQSEYALGQASSVKILTLAEMFPHTDINVIEDVASTSPSINEAVQMILDSPKLYSNKSTGSDKAFSLEDLLSKYQQLVSEGRSVLLDIERERIWVRSLIFYKSKCKDELQRPISINFEGPYEHGIDAGGLKGEYFGDLMRAIDSNLFEGNKIRRVPIHSWEKANLMKLAGIMIAHSILHSGPAFPVLAPYVYNYIANGEKDLSAGFVEVDDIPETPANVTLSSFIKALCDASNDEGITDVLDTPQYSVLVDRSGWPAGKLITQKTRQEFINELLVEELITKRLVALNNFREGLNHFSLIDMLGNSSVGSHLFVTQTTEACLTAEKLLSCFEKATTSVPEQLTAYNNLRRFIAVHENVKEDIPALGGNVEVLRLLLKFLCAVMSIPPLGFKKLICIEFLPEDNTLPDADACFMVLKIPVKHREDFKEFSRNMMIALKYSSCAFGQN